MPDHNDDRRGLGPDAEFASFLAHGKFMIQRSARSGAHLFPPRLFAPGSGADDLEWIEASGRGTVYSTTVVRRRPDEGGDYNVDLIDLDEGPRMMSRVVGVAPNAVTIGMPVRARIGEIEGETVVLFAPDEEGPP